MSDIPTSPEGPYFDPAFKLLADELERNPNRKYLESPNESTLKEIAWQGLPGDYINCWAALSVERAEDLAYFTPIPTFEVYVDTHPNWDDDFKNSVKTRCASKKTKALDDLAKYYNENFDTIKKDIKAIQKLHRKVMKIYGKPLVNIK